MKRVRMLLRVSSDKQLEADGDLSIQRQILIDFINRKKEWVLDEKEYFEGSKSAYKNTASERDILQKILQDAESREFDVLVPYKDDRVGRLMWDTPLYIMSLKNYGVDVYTVKDGCISPDPDDIMGQMMLAFRYANAQKSSADTGMRVKDTAQKLVQKGKYMGGCAPFGYTLEYSGQISKHGRALKHLVIVPEQAELIKHIYDLSLNREYGSAKIAKELNLDEQYKTLAPNKVWKSGTITSILTNPIYAGHTAYKRRERVNGKYHRLDSADWITSFESDASITIIDGDTWNRVQEKRKMRNEKYRKKTENRDVTVIGRNDGMLPLIDVIHCGYCGRKLTNGTKYSYWKIKKTGEKRTSKTAIYKCQNAWQGVLHEKTTQFRADSIEPVIFEILAAYIEKLQENYDVCSEIEKNKRIEQKQREKEMEKIREEIDKMKQKIEVMENNIPNAMTGEFPLSLEELVMLIKKQKKKLCTLQESASADISQMSKEWDDGCQKIPSWREIFLNADLASRRVIVNKLIERITIKKEEIVIRFKINLNDLNQ